mmetsp:Transcript_7570/g.15682  ORF Transcript_7570/g.15682 Transcript_7570/m.15682 type:complete len:302 (+) Transcript_7570:288-1193(+)
MLAHPPTPSFFRFPVLPQLKLRFFGPKTNILLFAWCASIALQPIVSPLIECILPQDTQRDKRNKSIFFFWIQKLHLHSKTPFRNSNTKKSVCYCFSSSLSLGLFAPLVFFPDGGFLVGRKIVGNVEGRTNLVGRLALDHRSNCRTGQIQQWLDIHVVGRQNELKQEYLLEIHKVRVPLLDHVGHGLALQRFFDFGHGFVQMVLAEFNDLSEDFGLDIGQRNLGALVILVVVVLVFVIVVVHHGLDEFRHVGHRHGDGEFVALLGYQLNIDSGSGWFLAIFDIHDCCCLRFVTNYTTFLILS